MQNKNINLLDNEHISVRYLNLFRLLISFFFFSIIFKKVGTIVGFTYMFNEAKFIAALYLAFSILVWIISLLAKNKTLFIGLIALIVDLPFIISLTLLFDGLNNGWVILPVITIGSFSILNHKSFSIFAMPVLATMLLSVLPSLLQIPNSDMGFSKVLLYAIIYFAIAFVGIRQSQAYNISLRLTQKQRKKITDLSKINGLIIEQLQSGVVAFDNDFKILSINKHARELLITENQEKLSDKLIHKIENHSKSHTFTMSLSGEDVIVNMILLENSEDVRLLLIEKQAAINKKSLQLNLANLGQLSATIAHELRNPMAAIYSAAQLLGESETVNAEDGELTEIICSQIDRSNQIIEDILLMSKPHISYKEKIDAVKLLENFKRDFSKQNDLTSEQITLEVPSTKIIILFDNSHLNQLFWNLTENAFKHGVDHKLTITLHNLKDSVLIDFKNNGDTFKPYTEDNLFTPFFTTHTKGTGLGLYICREMCRSNNAKLEYLRQEFQHVFRIHVSK